ncbi:restriction endonuclease subunit S [Clostridium perfringens]
MENKKNILDVVSISGLRVKKFEGERGYLSTGDLDFNKISNIELVSYENKPSRANQNVNVGEVIFAKMKDTKKTLVIDEENKDIIVSTGFYVLKPSEQILSKYLYHYLNSDYFLNQKNKLSKGATQCALNNEGLSNITIYMYNLETQKKIVEVLDKAQELIEKRKKQIEELDLLVKSKFIEMFGNPITNSKGWNIKLLGEVCEMKAGKNIKSADIYEKNNGKLYPCYGGNGLRGYVRDYSHDGNIPLIGRQGALCGNVKYAKGKFYATEHAVVTNPKIEMNTYWLYYILEQLDLNRLSTGAAQPGLTVGKLKEVELPIAPIGMQNDFENFAKQVDKLKFEMEHSLKELEDNFNSLMQKAFKGELFN